MNVRVSPHRVGASAAMATLIERALPMGMVRFEVTDRAAWMALRGADVTASVAAALVGEHPYMTRLGLYALKTGQGPDTEAEPVITETSISLPPMLRGTILEPVVPALLAQLRPTWQVEKCGWYYRQPGARIGATPDLFAIDPKRKGFGIIQVKTTDHKTFRKVWRADAEDEGPVAPPLFIVIQAIIEAVLTGASWACVGVMVSGSTLDLHLIDVPIHTGIMDRLRAEIAEFWRGVSRGEPPQADYGRDAEVLAALYREGNGRELDLSANNRLPLIIDDRDQLLAEIRERKERVSAIDCECKEAMGAFETAFIGGNRRLTWREEERKPRFDFGRIVRVFRVSQKYRR